jgi:hypothetical protein
VRNNKTWRAHHDLKDFEIVMRDGYQQIEDHDTHCHFPKVKKDVRSNLRKKIEGR